MQLTPVQPLTPAAPWIGGKKLLAERIIKIIQGIPHTTYAEPFVGMGGVFFRRPARPKAEAINDLNRDVWGFFRVLQEHYVPFVEMMRLQIASRAEFERLCRVDPDTLTDMKRAARFLYLQKTGFGGKVRGRTFGIDPSGPARFDVTKLIPHLDELHNRLAGVWIEQLAYAEFIRRWDRPGTLFYIDPPYWGTEDYYGKELFSAADFTALAEQLAGIKGRFILSINDVKPVREIFRGFKITPVKTRYTANGKSHAKAGELIIQGPRRTDS